MDDVLWVVVVVVACVLSPWVFYLTAKLGAYGFYRGRQIFHEEEKQNEQEKAKKDRRW